jgi:putative spermidine/putrescine transport system permease protein
MAEAQAISQVMTTADGTPLKVSLNRALRRNKLRAFLWVAPLLAFIAITFLIPIFDMVFRSVENSLVAQVMHRTVPLLRGWDDSTGELPSEEVFAALLADVAEGKKNKTIGKVGTLLNYQEPGMASVFRSSPRKFSKIKEPPYQEQMIKANKKWGDVKTWRAIKNNSGKFTPAYFLSAVDLKQDNTGSVTRQPEERRIYIKLFIRTMVLSTVITALCFLLGFPISYLLATLPARTSNLL